MPDDFIFKLRKKDEESWQVAYEKLWPIAMNAAKSSFAGLNYNDVEEVAISVLKDISGKTESVDSFDSLKALTCVIAKRKAISRKRMLNAEKRDEGKTASLNTKNDQGTEIIDLIPTPEESPLSELQESEVTSFVKDFVNTLEKGKIKDVIECVFIKGLTNVETANHLQIPPNSVGVYKTRGIMKLIEATKKNQMIMKYIEELLR